MRQRAVQKKSRPSALFRQPGNFDRVLSPLSPRDDSILPSSGSSFCFASFVSLCVRVHSASVLSSCPVCFTNSRLFVSQLWYPVWTPPQRRENSGLQLCSCPSRFNAPKKYFCVRTERHFQAESMIKWRWPKEIHQCKNIWVGHLQQAFWFCTEGEQQI